MHNSQIIEAAYIGADYFCKLLNSNFFTALAGAAAGAYGAQYIVEKIKIRESLLKEIRNTNTAIALTLEILNTMLNIKKQHVKALYEDYVKTKSEFINHQNSANAGTYQFITDFKSLSPPFIPIYKLLKILFDDISLDPNSLLITSTLNRTLDSFRDSLERRNALIADYYRNSPLPQQKLFELYFGLKDQNGHIDSNYPDALKGIYDLNDDAIYFSRRLMGELIKHGKSLSKIYGKNSPKISESDLSKAVRAGLMPNEYNYLDWESIFKKANLEV